MGVKSFARRGTALCVFMAMALIAMAVPPPVLGAGLGVGPHDGLLIDAAVPGEEYQRLVYVMYADEESDSSCILELHAQGDVGQWVSFWDHSNPTVPLTEVTAPANEWVYIEARFAIPEEIDPGEFSGVLIVIQAAPPETEPGWIPVLLQGRVNVTINVAAGGNDGGTSSGFFSTAVLSGIIGGVVLLLIVLGVWLTFRRREARG